MIFKFSSEIADDSSETSSRVINFIIEKSYKNKQLTQEKREELENRLTTPIRKIAHFSIYTCLGFLLYLLTNTFEISNKKRILISIILAFMYAISDELHQYFVPGRSCEIRDVLIDTFGSLFGIGIALVVLIILRKIKKYIVAYK